MSVYQGFAQSALCHMYFTIYNLYNYTTYNTHAIYNLLCFQFQTPKTAMETLFGLVNGDEIFTTMAILELDKSGSSWVFWFSRVYIGAYVAVFTIVVINLLIGIFMTTYEAIRVRWWCSPST